MKDMTIKTEVTSIQVNAHNKREEALVRITQNEITEVIRYYYENTFGEHTNSIIKRNIEEIKGHISAMFFLEMIGDSEYVSTIYDIHDIINI